MQLRPVILCPDSGLDTLISESGPSETPCWDANFRAVEDDNAGGVSRPDSFDFRNTTVCWLRGVRS